mmetsp:Transcript_18242/g.18309  ORF Transcript_18242/g.18309 Transcript_18242/m.18309 type:complete len:363 (-) Transcript_18242:27-1115(-)
MNGTLFTLRRFFGGNVFKRSAVQFTTTLIALDQAIKNGHASCDNKSSPNSFSYVTYDANNPPEDRYSVQEEGGWSAYAVFDGHGGWQVSEFSKNMLFPTLLPSITKVEAADSHTIRSNILTTFQGIEKKYIDLIRPAYKLGHGSVASVGSCVVMALIKEKELYIASCGDCRAVIAIKDETDSSQLLAHRITQDHNAREKGEAIILRALHPNEPDVVICKSKTACYVKGRLQLTCALGDLYLKYAEFNPPAGSHRSLGRHIPPPYTPPYVRSIPDIFHRKLTTNDRYLILASDGVWDFMTDQEAVNAIKDCNDVSIAADIILNIVLTRAAKECGLNIDELKQLPRGNARRHRHDDTTVIVVKL